MFIPMGIAIVFYSPKPIFTLPAMMVAYTACWPYLALTCLRVIAKLEIGNSQYETMKSNHEMSAEGMGRTFCPTPKMATAVARHPGMVNMGAEAAVRVI